MPRLPDNKQSLRTGFTTGACAAAAARAATLACIGGIRLSKVETVLPNGAEHVFVLQRCEPVQSSWVASIIKDAGDDPDCTHGAEIVARVTLTDSARIELRGAEGIATVTKQGLGLELGSLAITPIPRRNLLEMVNGALETSPHGKLGASVELSVPGGEELSKQTLNERLGLVGGISILGTSGIVRPYSTAAFRASVVNAIDLAAAVGHRQVVLSTGGKTESRAMRMLPALADDAFIQAGDFIGTAVKSCARLRLGGIVVAMIGKLSKMADGKHMTHAAGSSINLNLLAEIAVESGADQALASLVKGANTARHALELCLSAGLSEFGFGVCRRSASHLSAHAVHSGFQADIRTVLLGFDGGVLGCWPRGFLASQLSADGIDHE